MQGIWCTRRLGAAPSMSCPQLAPWPYRSSVPPCSPPLGVSALRFCGKTSQSAASLTLLLLIWECWNPIRELLFPFLYRKTLFFLAEIHFQRQFSYHWEGCKRQFYPFFVPSECQLVTQSFKLKRMIMNTRAAMAPPRIAPWTSGSLSWMWHLVAGLSHLRGLQDLVACGVLASPRTAHRWWEVEWETMKCFGATWAWRSKWKFVSPDPGNHVPWWGHQGSI